MKITAKTKKLVYQGDLNSPAAAIQKLCFPKAHPVITLISPSLKMEVND